MLKSRFWKSTAERAIKTAAQALVAMFLADATLDVLNTNWGDVFGVAGTAALLSVLTSIVSAPIGPTDSPSVVNDGSGDQIRPL